MRVSTEPFYFRWPPEDNGPPRTGDSQAIRERLDAAGIRVWFPTDDPPHHDALVEQDDGSVARVRFEPGWLVDGRMRFDTGDRDRPSKEADPADYVFVYCEEREQMYVIEREAYDTTISLRIDSPEKPHSQSNPASEYEFPAAWPE